MLTIKGKIILASTIVFGATLVVFAMLVYRSTRQAELAKIDARLESHCDKIETELEEQIVEHTFPNVADLLDISTDGLPMVRIQLWNPAGDLVASDSLLRFDRNGLRQSRQLRVAETRDLTVSGQLYRCRWFPLEIEDQVQVVVQVAASQTGLHENLSHLRTLFLIAIPAALLFIALAVYLITRSAFMPLTGMARAAQRISGSTLHERLAIPQTQDEVRSLAETLNGMIQRLDDAFRSQRQFVADASHEIRTPLTIISSELEFAQKAASEPVVQESLKVSLLEVDRLSRMVQSLLLLTRLDSSQVIPNPQPFRLDELVVDLVSRMRRPALIRSVHLDVFVESAIEIQADQELVQRAILNVLDNACKYSPAHHTVSVALRTAAKPPDTAIIEIADLGPGISPGDQARVFERFYRSPEARSDSDGSGLGLAISKMLIELNHGAIRLVSAAGEGTRVTIELPLLHAKQG